MVEHLLEAGAKLVCYKELNLFYVEVLGKIQQVLDFRYFLAEFRP